MSFGLYVLAHRGKFTRDGLFHNRWPLPHPGELSLAHMISFAAGGTILAVSTVVEVPHVYRIFNIATLIQYTSRRKTWVLSEALGGNPNYILHILSLWDGFSLPVWMVRTGFMYGYLSNGKCCERLWDLERASTRGLWPPYPDCLPPQSSMSGKCLRGSWMSLAGESSIMDTYPP